MTPRLSESRLANIGAFAIQGGFRAYRGRFQAITHRAQTRFEARDWQGMQRDAAERLALYREIVDEVVSEIQELLGTRQEDRLIWAGMKAVYSGLIAGYDDWELAETFFNSITRRLFTTVGVDPQIEFVTTDYETPPTPSTRSVYRSFGRREDTVDLVRELLTAYAFAVPYADLEGDARAVAAAVERRLSEVGALRTADRVEVVCSPFFRGKGAYLIGRLYSGSHLLPLMLALTNTVDGVVVDAVLLEESAASILFSFAWTYFHVETERPYDLVRFLRAVMPRKRIAELYISLGFNKHGKTELYRDLLRHLRSADDCFEIAPGQRGMVMTVFTMPSYDMVFKIIRDQFAAPKDSTRQEVRQKYALVFRHDRAGRLIDAQEFEHMQIERSRFAASLLAELEAEASATVTVGDEFVTIAHLYVERRVTPLDIYIREAPESAAEQAVADYGEAIKDLARSNIFPGDMMLKNFGVTRHGRVVFYDYDELCLLTTCRFRRLPPPASYEDELAAEPWFHVRHGDIFPEEFGRFLGLSEPLRRRFEAEHGDLFDPAYWREMQAGLTAGRLFSIIPYAGHTRLHQDRPDDRC